MATDERAAAASKKAPVSFARNKRKDRGDDDSTPMQMKLAIAIAMESRGRVETKCVRYGESMITSEMFSHQLHRIGR